MAKNVELSIVIVEFNTKDLLADCLRSIFQETQKTKFEVIVVDNDSSDNLVGMVKKNFPSVKIIHNAENRGFAKANNQGIQQAKGEYLLFLNSDTIILKKAIDKVVEFMNGQDSIDILGCRLLNPDRSVQPSGGFFPKLKQIFYMMFFLDDVPFINKLVKPYQQARKDFYNHIQKLDWVTGAFFLVKKELLNKIGGFDENFFMYGEEVDLCFRAKRAGFRVGFYPRAEIIHLKGKSSLKGFETAVLGEYEGLKLFYKKYQPSWTIMIMRTLLKLGSMLRIFIFGILKGDKEKGRVYAKAFNMA